MICGLCASTGSATPRRSYGPAGVGDVAWATRETAPYMCRLQLFDISLKYMW